MEQANGGDAPETIGPERPPKDMLVRAVYPAVEVRAAEDDEPPVLFGHFAVFDQWTEIDSAWEGHFLERISPGAFRKTFKERGEAVRLLFQHGSDPQIGDKPLGVPSLLSEDERGAYYEAPLFDTSYNRDLLPGLRAGAYGASFRFAITKEDFNKSPDPGPHNPRGLPERTIREVQLFEFGPVTFPAYSGATAGVRSLTDDYIRARLGIEPTRNALPSDGAGTDHSDEGSREAPVQPEPKPAPPSRRAVSQDEFVGYLTGDNTWNW